MFAPVKGENALSISYLNETVTNLHGPVMKKGGEGFDIEVHECLYALLEAPLCFPAEDKTSRSPIFGKEP